MEVQRVLTCTIPSLVSDAPRSLRSLISDCERICTTVLRYLAAAQSNGEYRRQERLDFPVPGRCRVVHGTKHQILLLLAARTSECLVEVHTLKLIVHFARC